MKTFLMCLLIAIASGCSVKAVQQKAVVVPPSKNPTIVNITATGISTDYLFVHTAGVMIEVSQDNTMGTGK